MLFYNYSNIPRSLLRPSNTDEDLTILIGENGSGKSTLLSELLKYYSNKQDIKVIAIANTIHDKFTHSSRNIEKLKSSLGKGLVKRTIKNALRLLVKDDFKRINNLARTLEYVGYEPVIGIKLVGLKFDYLERLERSFEISDEIKNEIKYLLRKSVDGPYNSDRVSLINLSNHNFVHINNSYLLHLLSYEKELKRLKIIRDLDIYVDKKGDLISVGNASSGELTVITTLFYITSTISEKSVILVDEPENSLHPKWQIEYTKLLNDLFYFYQPKIVIATHSPLIINGAEINSNQEVSIFKGSKGQFQLQDKEPVNVEEIYQRHFDLTTPQNRYLSEFIITKMNLLASKEMSIESFEQLMNELKRNSYDEHQKQVLSGIVEMGWKITRSR